MELRHPVCDHKYSLSDPSIAMELATYVCGGMKGLADAGSMTPNGNVHMMPQTAMDGALLDTSNPAVIWKAIDMSMVSPVICCIQSIHNRLSLAKLVIVMRVRKKAGARQPLLVGMKSRCFACHSGGMWGSSGCCE